MIFGGAYRYRTSISIIDRINIYSYTSSSWYYMFAIPPAVYRNYPVGENSKNYQHVNEAAHFWSAANKKKMRVKHCYVGLSSRYEFWFAVICINMNVILDLSTAIQQF